MVAVHYGARAAKRYNKTVPRALTQLAPAFRAALALNREISNNIQLAATRDAVLDVLATPAFILDERALVRTANAQANVILQRGDMIRMDRRFRAYLCDPRGQIEFLKAVRRATIDAASGDIAIRSPEATCCVLSLFPITTEALRVPACGILAPERLGLVIIREVAPEPVRLDKFFLWHAFGLTPAEAHLANRLVAGDTLDTAAAALRISKETARSQLKQIFTKTDTHRQAELVAFLCRSRSIK